MLWKVATFLAWIRQITQKERVFAFILENLPEPNNILPKPNNILHEPKNILHEPNNILPEPNNILHEPNNILPTQQYFTRA